MTKKILPVLALLAAGLLTSAAVQKRVKAETAEDFPALLKAAGEAWSAGQYGTCLSKLRTATGLAMEKRSESIRAALPAAPAGWKLEPPKKQAANNAFAAALGGAVGNVTQARYSEEGGRGSVDFSMISDSPTVEMFNMWVANPAMLGDGAELIEYEAHKAVLKKERSGLSLQILIHKKHMCEIKARGLDEDGLFAMFDQRVVDEFAKVLGD